MYYSNMDISIFAIAALLPLSALMLVTQVNPYNALIIRGILGAVAALLYAVLGAADVALTEALVGTMLSITLYTIAVRSSMTVRLGTVPSEEPTLANWVSDHIRPALKGHNRRLEVVSYSTMAELKAALEERDIHMLCLPASPAYRLETRIPRLHRLLQTAIQPAVATVSLANSNDLSSSEVKS